MYDKNKGSCALYLPNVNVDKILFQVKSVFN